MPLNQGDLAALLGPDRFPSSAHHFRFDSIAYTTTAYAIFSWCCTALHEFPFSYHTRHNSGGICIVVIPSLFYLHGVWCFDCILLSLLVGMIERRCRRGLGLAGLGG